MKTLITSIILLLSINLTAIELPLSFKESLIMVDVKNSKQSIILKNIKIESIGSKKFITGISIILEGHKFPYSHNKKVWISVDEVYMFTELGTEKSITKELNAPTVVYEVIEEK